LRQRKKEKKKKKTDKKSIFSSRTCAVGSNDGLKVHERPNQLFAAVRLEVDESQAINAPRRHIVVGVVIGLFGSIFRPRHFAFRRTRLRLLCGARRVVR
jgi:hypothetical protein